MKRTRTLTSTVAVLVAGILAGASGCGSTPDDPGASGRPKQAGSPTAGTAGAERVAASEQRACEGGTYTWFNLRKQSVLNGVADAQRVTAEATKMVEPIRRLRTDQASLRSDGPRPDAQDVFLALSVHLGFAEKGDEPEGGAGLGEPGTYAPLDEGGGEVTGHAARLVNFSSVTLVETDFRYTCGSRAHQEPTTGHVSTWTTSGGGILDCDEPLPKGASAAAREAGRLSCGR
ncbi:hypothetical protein [Streptomyces sp. NBC_01013]|uniref:hypothetical protein n=1 Tax=Streptomyces sp. NBC_01013 TaxID=2903718 RepID=UPI003868902C|nr:hypothetical protein OG538_12345 [Streptomyces sp. NBC_01013]